MEDMLSFGGGLSMAEHTVGPEEAGRFPGDLPSLAGCLIVGVARGRERFPFNRCADLQLQMGDIIVYISGGKTSKE
jgi:hypothetical protein